MTAIVLAFLLRIALLGFEVNPVQLNNDIFWMRWGGTCWWLDLSQRKDGPKLPVWQDAYDFISMTYNYHVIKGNVKPGTGGNPTLCAAPAGVDTSLMIAPITPPIVPPLVVVTLITAPLGSIVNGTDTWSFGTATSTGGNALVLNGTPTSGFGNKLQLSAGKVYTLTLQNTWFVWNGAWTSSVAPQ